MGSQIGVGLVFFEAFIACMEFLNMYFIHVLGWGGSTLLCLILFPAFSFPLVMTFS